jgi:signal transduction histidine kinase
MPIEKISQLLLKTFDDASQIASLQLHANISMLFLITDKKPTLVAWSGFSPEKQEININKVVEESIFYNQSILKVSQESADHQEIVSFLKTLGLRSSLLFPIHSVNKLSGIWLIASQNDLDFQDDDLLFQQLVNNLSLTLQIDKLSIENLHYRRESEAIRKISTEISQYLDIDQVLKVIVEKACELLNAEISYLALADDESQMIRVRITHGARGEALQTLTHKYGEGVGGIVAVTHQPVIVDNYPEGNWPKPHGTPSLIATENIVSAMCVPMVTRRGLVGVLYVASRFQAGFTQAHLDLLHALGTQAAIAIENARLYDEQKESAESLRAGIANNERLLGLVLENQGLQGIADALSDMVHCPILVEDSRFQLLCSSFHGCSEEDPAKIQSLQASFTDFWKNPEQNQYRQMLQNTRHSIRVPKIPEQKHQYSRIIAPIVAGTGLVGYVSVIETGQPLDEQKYSTVEQTSIVFALEFVKQEAARTGALHHVITAQEEERKRIARELHDETSQALTALIIGLDTTSLALSVNSQDAGERLSATRSIAEGLLKEIKRIISDLRPSLLDDLGLVPAIAWYGEQRLKPLGIKFAFEGNALADRLPPSMETVLFRIVQEAITNIIRHANASSVCIRLDLDNNDLILKVTDNGMGFDPQIMQSPNSSIKALGLLGMQERIRILDGEVQIQTTPGKGTTITARVPMP